MVSLVAQLAMSLFVLLFATANWQVALLSMCSIVMTTIWSMSFMFVAGWSFGILEAICVTVLVGLAVDYVVHMGMSYLESPSKDRRGRTIFACEHMGISICSGAISTVGASVFLTCCTITFFPKFGIFMAVTIIFSFICAGIIFPAALMELGPEGNTGALGGIFGGSEEPVEMEMNSGDDAEHIENEHDVDLLMPSQEGSGVTTARVMGLWALIIVVCTFISYIVCPPGQTFCAALPAETKEFWQEFKMPGFHVTSQQTTYECHGFDFPQVIPDRLASC
jgi:multidrug efflux pump subunit AcrB